MEVAIPLIALGGMYVISNQSSRKSNPNSINGDNDATKPPKKIILPRSEKQTPDTKPT